MTRPGSVVVPAGRFRAPRPSGTDWLRRTAAYTRRSLELPATQERPQFLMAPFSYWDFEVRFTWRLFTERRTAWLARMAQETTAAAERPDLVPVAEIACQRAPIRAGPSSGSRSASGRAGGTARLLEFYDPPADADVTAPFVSPETIRQATLRVARHVDLELRRGSPGRPRTDTDSRR